MVCNFAEEVFAEKMAGDAKRLCSEVDEGDSIALNKRGINQALSPEHIVLLAHRQHGISILQECENVRFDHLWRCWQIAYDVICAVCPAALLTRPI
jgi:hypothetical protein